MTHRDRQRVERSHQRNGLLLIGNLDLLREVFFTDCGAMGAVKVPLSMGNAQSLQDKGERNNLLLGAGAVSGTHRLRKLFRNSGNFDPAMQTRNSRQ